MKWKIAHGTIIHSNCNHVPHSYLYVWAEVVKNDGTPIIMETSELWDKEENTIAMEQQITELKTKLLDDVKTFDW